MSEDKGALEADRCWLQIATGDEDVSLGKDVDPVLGRDIDVVESYDVHVGIFQQPSRFSMRLGWGNTAWDLLEMFKPGNTFKMRVAGNICFTGQLDAVNTDMRETATTLVISGRDSLAPLYDAFVQFEKSFNDETFSGLVRRALVEAGMPNKLVTSNTANRKIRTGVAVRETGQPVVIDDVKKVGPHEFVGVIKKVESTKIGERWLDFVRHTLDRAGLFLWAAADGSIVLSAPNTQQAPVYHLIHRRGSQGKTDPSVAANVIAVTYKNDTTSRHTEVLVYGRSGRVRSKSKGQESDQEMIAYGFKKPLVIRDSNVKSPAQAGFLARRKIAEERRSGSSLTYTVNGHTTPCLNQPGVRAVWSPDTMVLVDDYELGIVHKLFYVEACNYRRGGDGTTTTITLQRAEDMVFGDPHGD